jgi:uncharacterized membrane protein
MILRTRLKEPFVLIRIGLVFLILASLSRWFVHPGINISERVTDGVTGLLYGVSIGCMLLGLLWHARRRSGTHAGPCS